MTDQSQPERQDGLRETLVKTRNWLDTQFNVPFDNAKLVEVISAINDALAAPANTLDAMREALEDIATLKVTGGAAANLAQRCLDNIATPVPSPDGAGEGEAWKSLRSNIQSKIAQLTHYRDNDCQLDHARTIAEGRILQANQDLLFIDQALQGAERLPKVTTALPEAK